MRPRDAQLPRLERVGGILDGCDCMTANGSSVSEEHREAFTDICSSCPRNRRSALGPSLSHAQGHFRGNDGWSAMAICRPSWRSREEGVQASFASQLQCRLRRRSDYSVCDRPTKPPSLRSRGVLRRRRSMMRNARPCGVRLKGKLEIVGSVLANSQTSSALGGKKIGVASDTSWSGPRWSISTVAPRWTTRVAALLADVLALQSYFAYQAQLLLVGRSNLAVSF